MTLNEQKIKIVQVSPGDPFVQQLIVKLDQYQLSLYDKVFCHLDSIETLIKSDAYMLGAYSGERLTGIGAVKLFDNYAEIKRMFIEEEFRSSGIAKEILNRLEEYAGKNGKRTVCLETGNLQKSAIRFYQKLGYAEIENFGDYEPNEVSVFFSKKI